MHCKNMHPNLPHWGQKGGGSMQDNLKGRLLGPKDSKTVIDYREFELVPELCHTHSSTSQASRRESVNDVQVWNQWGHVDSLDLVKP